MIVKGRARSGAAHLAAYLMRQDDKERPSIRRARPIYMAADSPAKLPPIMIASCLMFGVSLPFPPL